MLKNIMRNDSSSPKNTLFKEDFDAIIRRFFVAIMLAVGVFVGGELSDSIDQSTEFGSAIALLLTWAGNAIFLYFKNNKTESAGDG